MTNENQSSMGQTYSIGFDVDSPSGLQWARALLEEMAGTEGVVRVSLEVESTTPLDAPALFPATESDGLSASATDASTNEPEPRSPTHECDACGEEFSSQRALSQHQRECDSKSQSHNETYSFSVGTSMFKTASVLSHVDSKLTAGEMAELLEGTKWEIDQSQLSNLMGALYRDAVAERSKRPVERQGDSPYEYWLNEEGQAAYAEAHAEAQRHDIDTFSDITSSESESDSDEEPTESSAEGISLTQGSTLYRTVSLLSLTDGLTTREIEEKLEETDWETDYETLTDALETLFEHELVERERRSAPGRPYAYSLSESGRRLASEKLLDSDTSDAGALADVFIEQTSEDAETESGLDELFKRETDEGEELALFTDTGATPPSE